ncbi:TetR/AcrR family transcriptional regulator [Streptomyces sp. NPDC002588]|uniref:TetR/AcrR family transcriptional regulator n=1 Tax=Streptomyces sp. NPDC002588 TaxID=3154419 RepID=UPI003317C0D1
MPRQAEPGATPRARRGRGRRPADEVRADALDAAGALLLDEGMGAFTIEAVAERAGVSKTTIYKWWPSKGALALDGYFHAVESALAFPDSGDLEADLTAQLRSFVHVLTATPAGRVIAELIGQAQTDPDLAAALLQRYSGPRRELAVRRMRHAQEQGELRADVDPEILVDQLWGSQP